MCQRFFTSKNGYTGATAEVTLLGGGAEASVYKCEITDPIVPNVAALKIYHDTEGRNITELKAMDEQLTQQGLRYPVYEWMDDKAKFEEFLDGKSDNPDFSNSEIRTTVAQTIARLHKYAGNERI